MEQRFRLRSSKAIQQIRQAGQSYASPLVVLMMLPNQEQSIRCAIIASRSVGGAVQRNRCRRLLRAAMSDFIKDLEKGHDLVLIARQGLLKATFDQIKNTTKKLLMESKLLNEPK